MEEDSEMEGERETGEVGKEFRTDRSGHKKCRDMFAPSVLAI